jgi:hypothetical protein
VSFGKVSDFSERHSNRAMMALPRTSHILQCSADNSMIEPAVQPSEKPYLCIFERLPMWIEFSAHRTDLMDELPKRVNPSYGVMMLCPRCFSITRYGALCTPRSHSQT